MIFSYKTIIKLTLSLGVLASTLCLVSCDKEEDSKKISHEVPSETLTKIAKNLPKVKIVDNSNLRRFFTHEGVTFIDGGEGFSFAEAQGPTFSTNKGITFAESANGSINMVDPSSAGLGGGGAVVAGSTSMNIDLALCYGADEDALDLGFDFGFDGVSAVIGISGDFTSLDENASDESIQDAFNGFAGYYVFDDNANGTYKVLDLDAIEDDNEPTGVSFAFVIDIKNGYYYISKSGKLTVNGGSITFNGDYYALKFDFYDTSEEMGTNWKVVSGFGTMGCD